MRIANIFHVRHRMHSTVLVFEIPLGSPEYMLPLLMLFMQPAVIQLCCAGVASCCCLFVGDGIKARCILANTAVWCNFFRSQTHRKHQGTRVQRRMHTPIGKGVSPRQSPRQATKLVPGWRGFFCTHGRVHLSVPFIVGYSR